MGRVLKTGGLILLVIGLALTLSSSALSNSPPQGPEPPTPTPALPTEVRLSAKDDGRQVDLSGDQILVISLEGNPSTGYGWEVEEGSGKIIRQVGEIEFRAESNLLGAPAQQIMRFQAVGEGQITLKLVYRHPWEKGVEPVKTFSTQVQAVGSFTGVDSSPTTSALPTTPEAQSPGESPVSVADRPSLPFTNTVYFPLVMKNHTTSEGLPSSFNWCDGGYCTPVKDQGYCGSCWAFGTMGPLESNILIHDGVTKDLSEQYLLSCNIEGWNCSDGGWWAHDYHWWKVPPGELQAGAVYESDFPYQAADVPCNNQPHNHYEDIYSWAYVGSQSGIPPVTDIKQAIYDHGPVSSAICVGSAFQGYRGGVFEIDASCSPYDVNHAVVLVGWDDSLGTDGVWILRNSWDTGWGEGGYMRIGYGVSNVGYAANYIVYP